MATIITFSSSVTFWFFLIFFSFLSLKTISQPRVNHLHTFCNNQNFTEDSSYDTNRKSTLKYLHATTSDATYLSVTKGLSPDIVYGMYHCRGDLTKWSKSTCRICVRTAVTQISRTCTSQKEAIIYYEECMVRYSDYSFFGLLETSPKFLTSSPSNFPDKSSFGETLSGKMDKLITRAASTTLWPEPYLAQDQQRVNDFDSSYVVESVVQCSPDIDPGNCTACLRLAVQDILDCCSRSRTAQNFLPKCLVRYNTSSLPLNDPTPRPSLGVIKGEHSISFIYNLISFLK